MALTKWHLMGPDGIPTQPDPFNSEQEALDAIPAFVARFEHEGYYSCADGTRMSLGELYLAMRAEQVEVEPGMKILAISASPEEETTYIVVQNADEEAMVRGICEEQNFDVGILQPMSIADFKDAYSDRR